MSLEDDWNAWNRKRRQMDEIIGPYQSDPTVYVYSRKELAKSGARSAWAPGDVVEAVCPGYARSGPRGFTAEACLVRLEARLPDDVNARMRWRVRWVGSDGVLGDEAVLWEGDLDRWIGPAHRTVEPAYKPKPRTRLKPGHTL